MKDEKELENKMMWKPPANKAATVKIRINPGRAIAGVGKAGEVVDVSELVAKNFVSQGLATYVKET